MGQLDSEVPHWVARDVGAHQLGKHKGVAVDAEPAPPRAAGVKMPRFLAKPQVAFLSYAAAPRLQGTPC